MFIRVSTIGNKTQLYITVLYNVPQLMSPPLISLPEGRAPPGHYQYGPPPHPNRAQPAAPLQSRNVHTHTLS